MLHISVDMHPGDERDVTIDSRHPRRWLWLLAIGVLTIAALALWSLPPRQIDRARPGAARPEPGAVGTSGSHDDEIGPEHATVVREIETITGANDAISLIGHRVDLHVDVQARANDQAFWVGSPDNRLLVVIGRDTHDGIDRHAGAPAYDRIDLRNGQRAAISGVVRRVPIREQRYSWDLTEHDEQELADRKVYIRAETITPES